MPSYGPAIMSSLPFDSLTAYPKSNINLHLKHIIYFRRLGRLKAVKPVQGPTSFLASHLYMSCPGLAV